MGEGVQLTKNSRKGIVVDCRSATLEIPRASGSGVFCIPGSHHGRRRSLSITRNGVTADPLGPASCFVHVTTGPLALGSRPMARLALRAMAILAGTIFLASSGIFFLIHLSGDPTYGFLPVTTSPEVRDAVRERLGLDRPLVEQYLLFLQDSFTLDFGYSWSMRQPAVDAVMNGFPKTMQLALTGTVTAVLLGVAVGVVTSARRSGPAEWLLSATTLVGLAIPGFWLGTLLILLFAVQLGWFPSSGSSGWRSMVLPVVALTLHPASMIARLVRANMREVESTTYIRTARAKGLPLFVVQWRHMLPNAILPAVAYVGLHAAGLIGGAIVIESVFAYPGVGRMALQAALERDLPVIHAFVVLSAAMEVLINVLVDLTAMVIDPRLRASQVASHAT